VRPSQAEMMLYEVRIPTRCHWMHGILVAGVGSSRHARYGVLIQLLTLPRPTLGLRDCTLSGEGGKRMLPHGRGGVAGAHSWSI
jgi:hypothetical protein